MWERRVCAPKLINDRRITPAHAGKTSGHRQQRPCKQDHPRTCGKDPACPARSGSGGGSPPHMRERPVNGEGAEISGGITPAHAGKTFELQKRQDNHEDHPRTCGKDWNIDILAFIGVGSPPHMRERLEIVRSHHLPVGITPAHAGKTNLSPVSPVIY